jgi:hypothetical protein
MKRFLCVVLLFVLTRTARAEKIDEANWQDANAWACAKTIAIKPPRVTGEFKGPQSQDAYTRHFAEELAAGLSNRFGAGAVTVAFPGDAITADLVIDGEFATLTTGSRAKRFWVGFGAGKSWADVRLRATRTATGSQVFYLRQERGSAMGLKSDELEENVDEVVKDIATYLNGVGGTCDPHAWNQPTSSRGSDASAISLSGAAADSVKVSVLTVPDAADVYIDGAFVGSTPLPELHLKPGDHGVEIRKAGFQVWKRTLKVLVGSPTQIELQLERDSGAGTLTP